MKKRELIKKGITLMNDKIQAGVESSLNRIVQQVIAYSTMLQKNQRLYQIKLNNYSTILLLRLIALLQMN